MGDGRIIEDKKLRRLEVMWLGMGEEFEFGMRNAECGTNDRREDGREWNSQLGRRQAKDEG